MTARPKQQRVNTSLRLCDEMTAGRLSPLIRASETAVSSRVFVSRVSRPLFAAPPAALSPSCTKRGAIDAQRKGGEEPAPERPRETDRPTDQPTDRQTDRPTNRPTDHPTNRQTERPTSRPTLVTTPYAAVHASFTKMSVYLAAVTHTHIFTPAAHWVTPCFRWTGGKNSAKMSVHVRARVEREVGARGDRGAADHRADLRRHVCGSASGGRGRERGASCGTTHTVPRARREWWWRLEHHNATRAVRSWTLAHIPNHSFPNRSTDQRAKHHTGGLSRRGLGRNRRACGPRRRSPSRRRPRRARAPTRACPSARARPPSSSGSRSASTPCENERGHGTTKRLRPRGNHGNKSNRGTAPARSVRFGAPAARGTRVCDAGRPRKRPSARETRAAGGEPKRPRRPNPWKHSRSCEARAARRATAGRLGRDGRETAVAD